MKFFASQASKITILDISAASGVTVLPALRTEFPKASFLFKKCDISSWDEQKTVFEEVYKEVGSIDVVFANAGATEIGSFLEKKDQPTKPNLRTLEINVLGTLYCEFLGVYLRARLRRSSYKLSSPLYAEEHLFAEGLDLMYSFECWIISFPYCANVCHDKTCYCGSCTVDGETPRG